MMTESEIIKLKSVLTDKLMFYVLESFKIKDLKSKEYSDNVVLIDSIKIGLITIDTILELDTPKKEYMEKNIKN